jgi:hypothetical protein
MLLCCYMLVDFARGPSQTPIIQGLEFFNRLSVYESAEECPSRSVTRVDPIAYGSSESIYLGVRLWQEGSKTLSKGDEDIGQDRETDS